MSFNSRMTFSNDFINARIADVMLETDRRPKPDYMRNEARFRMVERIDKDALKKLKLAALRGAD